jgi:hypothetical protein
VIIGVANSLSKGMIYNGKEEKHTIFFCYWTIPFAIAGRNNAGIDFGVGSRNSAPKQNHGRV